MTNDKAVVSMTPAEWAGCRGFGGGSFTIGADGQTTSTSLPACPKCGGSGVITIRCPGPDAIPLPDPLPSTDECSCKACASSNPLTP